MLKKDYTHPMTVIKGLKHLPGLLGAMSGCSDYFAFEFALKIHGISFQKLRTFYSRTRLLFSVVYDWCQ